MEYPELFSPRTIGNIKTANSILMAPMTRSRAAQPGDIPTKLNAEYYAQRASAGLIVSEATQVSVQGKGYARTPGIHSQEQVEGWKLVTRAVHEGGGRMVLQLWHVGRVSSAQVNGLQPVGPSAIVADRTRVYIFDGAPNGDATMIPCDVPRALSVEEIAGVVEEFRKGAANAIEAGFDGVEIHGANGYLIDQFLRSNSNQRTDEYGGSKAARIRLLMEITKAVVAEVGAERTGVRLSPFITFKDMADPEILDTIMLAAAELDALNVSFLHLCEADWDDAPQVPEAFRIELRKRFRNAIFVTGNYTPERGEEVLAKGYANMVGFGRKFLANPDLPERIRTHAPLNEITDTHTLFGGGDARGYTDYPALAKAEKAS